MKTVYTERINGSRWREIANNHVMAMVMETLNTNFLTYDTETGKNEYQRMTEGED
jgi:hypothetical protein